MIRLIKTTGGTHGSPNKCNGCSSVHFIKSGVAWHCASCGLYYPATMQTLKDNFEQLINLHSQLKFQIAKLEEIVKE